TINSFARVTLYKEKLEDKTGNTNYGFSDFPDLQIDSKAPAPLHKLENFLAETELRILFCTESKGRKESVKEHLANIGLAADEISSVQAFLQDKARFGITVSDIAKGFI